ncbi:precorrin-3B synthase [Gymnodinialimonas sp. 2305UL16-5]|uniref:precorrin-3B synthase n=1 Tax=Gymnodinialimonas mytili TaxID=3126503 RepID=UPI0030A0CA11
MTASLAKGPEIKGWCPGAHRPMMSGDGLVVRVRPNRAALSAAQVAGLAEAALTHGNGIIDLTSRANLQIRGVTEAGHSVLLEDLAALGLLDPDPMTEARRNLLVTPLWRAGDLTDRLYDAIVQRLHDLPDLPAKMGLAIDAGAAPILQNVSADLRFEAGADTPLILRADGAETGMPVTEADAVEATLALLAWFVRSGGTASGRMARHLRETILPSEFQGAAPAPAQPALEPGPAALGVAFGQLDATALAQLGTGIRVTPWRLLLTDRAPAKTDGFITDPNDPRLTVYACPGAPRCPQALAETRDLATRLAPQIPKGQTLHISGCAKGCAHPKRADITLVGANDGFDLVRAGTPWDEPSDRACPIDQILTKFSL